MSDAAASALLQAFTDIYPLFRCSGKSFYLEGSKGRKQIDTLEATLRDTLRSNAWKYEEILPHLKDIDRYLPELVEALTPAEEKPKLESFPVAETEGPCVGDILHEYELAYDILTDRFGLCEKGTTDISPISADRYREQLDPKDWKIMQARAPQTVFIYDTSAEPPKTKDVALNKLKTVTLPTRNLYVPPLWTHCEDKRAPLHEDHKRMIESRFATQDSLERYYCVLYHMLTSRNKNLCGLVHKREGTGKSTVMGKLPGYLVGMENTSYTDKNFMTSPHKDIFFNKRMVFLDEHRLTSRMVSIEKQFVEDMLYVNPKGKAAVTIPNVISFFMTSNEEKDIYTEPTNRRHYFLEDSGKHIVEEFGRDWVAEYNHRLANDNEFVANLGHYVLNEFRDPRFPPDAVYKGPTFERVVRATCFEYYTQIMDQLERDRDEPDTLKDPVLYSEQRLKFNRQNNGRTRFPNIENFCEFFENFQWGGEKIYRVERTSGDAQIILT